MKELNTHFDPIGHKYPIDERNLQFCDYIGHYIHVPPDDGGPISFKWHFPRGMLSKNMSGYELAEFVLKHMAAVIGMGLIKDHPRVEKEFEAMFVKLATSPKEVLDNLLSWIRVEWRKEEDDIIHMSLFDKTQITNNKSIFI